MKTKLFISFLLFCATIFVTSHMANTRAKINNLNYIIPSSLFIDQNNNVTPEFASLLHDLNVQCGNSLESVDNAIQKAWLRTAGKERWQTKELYETQRDLILSHAEKLSAIHEIMPTQSHYRYAILLGATLHRIRTRIAYLLELHNRGIIFDEIICLGSERALDPEIEKAEFILDTKSALPARSDWKFDGNLPKTESELFKFVYGQADLAESFRAIPIKFITTPNFTNPDGSTRRATTPDTIATWLATEPTPGPVLSVSNQPYCGYQDSVIRTYVPKEFTIETVGQAASDEVRNSDILDSFARMLYQEKIRRAKHN